MIILSIQHLKLITLLPPKYGRVKGLQLVLYTRRGRSKKNRFGTTALLEAGGHAASPFTNSLQAEHFRAHDNDTQTET